jgi:hypothetical protein
MSDANEMQSISGRLERGEIEGPQYLEQLTRYVVGQIGCTRAGLRVIVEAPFGRTLRCVAMYDSALDRMVAAADIVHPEGSGYLAELQRDGNVCIADARADPPASVALRAYLEESNVVSLMDMSFSVNGSLYGTFSCEQTGTPVEWSQRQLQALRRIASRASLTLVHVVNATVDTNPGALWESSTPNRLATMPMPLDGLPD